MADIPAVRIHNLSKSFSDIEVLRDIELTVNKGEVVSVLGSSGSGKSTMLRCINWLEEPDRGSIYIAGQRIGVNEEAGRRMTNRELAAIRAKTGMVFQGFNLWPHLSVLQNVMEAPVQVKGMAKEQARTIAIELLEKVGMGDKRDSYPYTLSGGQKQRVAIARVLAMSPEVILFDEPTSALDPERVGEVLTVMKNLSAEGYTMIVVTHEMEFARAVSDQVVFLEKGKIIEKSAPEKFFSNPETERVRKFLELEA
ncbi:glutamate ABC transporter ATP-binding protein [Pseudomonas daroniae]|uniref:Glutamate ABC transporter ATP-binding protein n=1 Tax=Phytopseudomonas daroniae TaxID=2487519 RepID=A0A4Q9QS22_9GAMM|nr:MULTISPECIES: amino acid ABC transporter ATP-binding protein [Pseudomonas]TBU78989.1 glutamate ABC transporter ATP-binding protein [Pseudomonas daroniae]TBU83102.1 glutamate ABC transporter ATP-binding protein [Pseudomonas sp. FRB 228]TBU83885.1 glutamate ABC transporter ATP-binding protein [Pseudomonas daroniae]TBU93062.1 glutamate ABC transporter ATP-binding protein [Pseudomonas daroniae]